MGLSFVRGVAPHLASATVARRAILVCSTVLMLSAFGCSSPEVPDAGSDGAVPDARIDAAGDACVPATCAGDACGEMDDGCGGTVTCSAGCACDPDALAETCAERPCEVAMGCDAEGACAYEPVTCSFERCVCPEGETCTDDDLRQCGESCGEEVCDPSPAVVGGESRFANVCRAVVEVTCGICDLGQALCEGDTLACTAPEIPGVFRGTANCDGSSPTASLVFLDPAYSGVGADGSRARPFVTLAEAVAAATLRGARAIVIGGSATLPGPLDVIEGLSIIGGYTGWPSWLASSARPIFETTADAMSGPARRVGLTATDVTDATVLLHLGMVTTNATGIGATNAGAFLLRSPGLVVRDLTFTVGAGGTGTMGMTGSVGASGGAGEAGATGVMVRDACTAAAPMRFPPGTEGRTTVAASGGASACSAGGAGGGIVFDRYTTFAFPQAIEAYVPAAGSDSPGGAHGGPVVMGGSAAARRGQDGAAATSPAVGGTTPGASLVGAGAFPVAAGSGSTGETGASGAGGGGGAASWHSSSGMGFGGPCTQWASGVVFMGSPGWFPGTGGGGGGGGCGGTGGTGGGPGGWSIGLVVIDSIGVTFDDVAVSLGAGGAGGPGGAGGGGGGGGPGGTTALSAPETSGGPGGNGGAGQAGGTGGAGASGRRARVYCDGAVPTGSLDGVSVSGGADDAQIGCE